MHYLTPARHMLGRVAGSGHRACMAERLEATKTVATKSGTASTKAATSVETTAAEAAVETAEAAMAAPATTRRHNVGCKHSKCCSCQQRDRDFTEHDQPSLVEARWVEWRPKGDQLPSRTSKQGGISMEPANPSTDSPVHAPSPTSPTIGRSGGKLQKIAKSLKISTCSGGEGGIRTPDRLAPMPHFECGAFNHSATSPGAMTGRDTRAPQWSGRVLGEDGSPDKASNA